jgi:2-polyprenyl-3-methyl-5-hydroxy-6-metoxy-1,4-benzoquinol methylase
VAIVAPALQRFAHRAGRLVLPPRHLWPFAFPGAAPWHEARWRWRLARAPVTTTEEHAAHVGVAKREEVIGCDLCGERRVQPLFAPRGKRKPWTYHVVRCPTCGFLYRNPGIQPARLGELYEGPGYGRFLVGKYSRKRQRRYRLVIDGFHPVFAEGAGRRLLDFGCGAGLFLEIAHERGFDGHGVDLSPDGIRRARKRPGGSKTYVGSPLDVPELAAGGFDVITLWSVMAHLAKPLDDLRMLRGLLAPDGILLILTINANSLLLKAQGEQWGGFTPNHLKFFSPATLTRALHLAGFPAVVVHPMYTDPVEAGTRHLRPRHEHRLRRAIDRGNRGNMQRALAFASADGPASWGLTPTAARPARRSSARSRGNGRPRSRAPAPSRC